MKAYIVTCPTEECAEIVFAESGSAARGAADVRQCDRPYIEHRARRAPELDGKTPSSPRRRSSASTAGGTNAPVASDGSTAALPAASGSGPRRSLAPMDEWFTVLYFGPDGALLILRGKPVVPRQVATVTKWSLP